MLAPLWANAASDADEDMSADSFRLDPCMQEVSGAQSLREFLVLVGTLDVEQLRDILTTCSFTDRTRFTLTDATAAEALINESLLEAYQVKRRRQVEQAMKESR